MPKLIKPAYLHHKATGQPHGVGVVRLSRRLLGPDRESGR